MTHTRWLLVLGAATAGLVLGLRFTACAPMPPGALHPPPAELREGASGARLEADVRHLFELGPRGQAHPQAMREAADWIEARLGAGGVPTSRQAVPVGSPSFENIIATVGESSDPQGAPRAPIVVGAHYDSWMDTAGADDNASGVAGLLELIRMLRALDSPPFVLLIAFATEEPPHFRSAAMGSAVHAQHAHERGAPIAFMISLEMLGYFRDDPGSQLYPSAHLRYRMPDRGDYIAIVGREEDEALVNALRDAMSVHARMPVYGYAAPSFVEGIDFSDHRSYWARGYPAVMLTDTAFLRNRAYHSADDTPERLDYERMALVVDGVFSALLELGAREAELDDRARPNSRISAGQPR